jgi:hypothetical protein
MYEHEYAWTDPKFTRVGISVDLSGHFTCSASASAAVVGRLIPSVTTNHTDGEAVATPCV